jgi:integrase
MALRKAVRDNILMKNPAENVNELPLPETGLVFLSPRRSPASCGPEINGKLGSEVRKAFIFAYYTGLRISDIRTLRWDGIERDPLQINKKAEGAGIHPAERYGVGHHL